MPQAAGEPTFVLVASSKNPASRTIASALIRDHGFESTGIAFGSTPLYQSGSVILATMDNEIIEPPDLDSYFRTQAYVFLSTHRAESGIPSLTVHTTGNFTDKEVLGARPREVGVIDPDLQKNYLIALNERRPQLEGYEVTIEATHHGPTSLKRPVLFVELGSSEKNWEDAHAAGVIADALMTSLSSGKKWEKVAIAFGGTHYPQKFNDALLNGEYALSAVVAKHYLEWIDAELFGQMIQKTTRFPRFVLVDWKGAGPHKEKIISLANQFALEVIRV
ncbi:MAG TPA: D-aminoacyl-tRNA deacylase [Nitrososphaerales archaeon]|nr:D-aminoacyl-tRNA deacylase [Nitrososphaerales archaeon]